MFDLGGNARATNNLARETREASKRETQATYQNTEAIKELAKIAEKMPVEIGDNLPKYSEREMRELREENKKLKEMATLIRPLGYDNAMGMYWMPNMADMTYELKLIFRDGSNVKVEDVRFSDESVHMTLRPVTPEQREVIRQATRF